VFEINTWVETFDSSAFTAAKPEAAWRAVDVAQVAGGPFRTLIPSYSRPAGSKYVRPRVSREISVVSAKVE
jgi:hypothetical protein